MSTARNAPDPSASDPHDHLVQFYESEDVLSESVAGFLAPALTDGMGTAVVIATEPHRRLFVEHLGRLGVDTDAARASGRLLLLDARDVLSRFVMSDGRPDPSRFEAAVGTLLARATQNGPVRAYGEMVDLLWEDGRTEAALLLEQLWNELQERFEFALLCAYAAARFYNEPGRVQAVCDAHGGVRPFAESRSVVPVQALAAEIAQRRRVEASLRRTLRELQGREAELAKGHSELREFVDSASIGLHWVAEDGTILWANQAELQMLGYDRSEYIGRNIAEFHADAPTIDDVLGRLLRREKIVDRPARLRAKDGTLRHVLIDSSVYERDGRFVHTQCFTRDVTQKKAAEERAQRLVRVTAAIAAAVTPDQVFAAIVDETAAALGASSAGLWLKTSDGLHARLARSVGYSESSRKHLEHVSLSEGSKLLPAVDVIHRRTPVWLESQGELVRAYPAVAAVVTPGRNYRICCLPILARDETLGSLGLSFDDARETDEEEKHLLTMVAQYAAQAIERLRLLETESASRALAESAARRLGTLSRISRALSETGPNATRLLQTLAEQVTSELADGCGILLTRGGRSELAAVHHRDPAIAESIRAAPPLRVDEGLTGEVLRTGVPLLVPVVDPSLFERAATSHRGWLDRRPPRSLLIVPLRAQGESVGTLSAMRDETMPPFDPSDLSLFTELAERATLALTAARLYEDNERSRIRTEALHELAASVIRAKNVDEVFGAALDAIRAALGASRSSILTFDDDGVMRFRAWRGLSDAYRAAVDGHSPWSRDASAPAPVIVRDAATDTAMEPYRALFAREGIGSLAFFPLVAGGKLLGKFMVYFAQPNDLTASDIDVATAIANHVSAGITRFAALEELHQSVRFNQMFTGILGHDLRNPLSAIMTAAQLALTRGESEKLVKPLSRILTSGDRMARMIDQLLDFTRVRVGAGMPVSRAPLDLVPVVREIIGELDIANPEWKLVLEHTGDTNGVWDRDRLSQVVSNLVANAIQHGLVSEGVRIHVDGTQKKEVSLEIWNAGTIPEPLRATIFEPMTGGERRRDGSRGLGLGLYISRQVVLAHGGSLTAACDAAGTTFRVTLPRSGPSTAA